MFFDLGKGGGIKFGIRNSEFGIEVKIFQEKNFYLFEIGY